MLDLAQSNDNGRCGSKSADDGVGEEVDYKTQFEKSHTKLNQTYQKGQSRIIDVKRYISQNEISYKEIIDYLKYNLRSQMFAKALPMIQTIGSLKRLELLRQSSEIKDKLWVNVNALQNGLKEKGFNIGDTNTCITPVYLEGSIPEAMVMVNDLRENYGIFLSIVVYPVIPKGIILLRMIPTASHTLADIDETLSAFEAIREKLVNGTYRQIAEQTKVDLDA